MDEVHHYKINVKWNEGRIGTLSSDSFPQIMVATPPEFLKGVAGVWSPEHLFVSSVAICLMTTFLAIAENSSLAFKSFNCEADGKLEKVEGKLMISEIELRPEVEVTEEKFIEKAERIIEKSEKACLISNSIKTKIILKPSILVNSYLNN